MMRHERLLIAVIGLIAIAGSLWGDSKTFGSLPSSYKESDHAPSILPLDFYLTQDKPLGLQPLFGTQAPQGPSCYVLPEAISMPSPLRLLGIDLGVNLLVQDVGMGPICATGVGLMFDSRLRNR